MEDDRKLAALALHRRLENLEAREAERQTQLSAMRSELHGLVTGTHSQLEIIADDVASVRRAVIGAESEGNTGLVASSKRAHDRLDSIENKVNRAGWAAAGWLAGGGGLGYLIGILSQGG